MCCENEGVFENIKHRQMTDEGKPYAIKIVNESLEIQRFQGLMDTVGNQKENNNAKKEEKP